jgi:hypothetical protein
MDPLTASAVAAVLNRVLGSAAAEAGKSAWAGLVKLVRSAFPERAAVAEAVERLTPGTAPDQNAVIDLSAELVGLARGDAGFDGALRSWLERAGSLSVSGGATTNVISDGATVHGNVVQSRDIGSISFGG